MDWGSLVAFAWVLSIAALILHLLWFWVLALLLRGTPAYLGIVAGWHAGDVLGSGTVGLVVAVLVTGLLSTAVTLGLRALARLG